MSDLIIPGWAVAVSGSIGMMLIAWLIFLTKTIYENKQAIAINSAHDAQVSRELQQIHEAIDNVKTSFTSDLKDLNQKLDMFLNREMNFLKELARKP